ncbi:GMC oxidoreductase [Streptomyces sp. NBC_01190]|uniref:GMC oxidoreductase n=1 Tax=Streptomyces sp. NBC_01190 TaxID=2903767 RepID=UPI0038673DA6|nr:GMC family oxidoreductase [Streptomyces sp. NBC_01190]
MTYDAIVVGSGAAGSWAAKTLAERGIRTLVLEAGPLFPGDHRVDRAAHDSGRQPVQSLCSAYEPPNSHLFVDDVDNAYATDDDAPFHWFRGRQVGGRLHVWAGVSLRMSDREFGGRDQDREGPAARGWPIRYRDVEPYYRRVETFMRVTGGSEPSPAAPAPAAAVRQPLTRGERLLADAVRRRWPGRQVVSGRVARAEAGAALTAALTTGRATLRPDAVVSHLELDRAGRRAEGVVFADRVTGVLHRERAATVILCASAIESVRILLNTRAAARSGAALGGDADLLGRHVFDHVVGATVSGLVPGTDTAPAPLGRPGLVPVCHIPDSPEARGEFSGGYGITLFAPEVLPMNGPSAAWASASGSIPFRLWASGEVLPRADNRITLAAGTDAWGIPQARIRLSYGPDEHAMTAYQAEEMTGMARAAGFDIREVTDKPDTPGTAVHEMGGAAMGDSPLTSVVDGRNRVWQLPNVLVADGSCFTTGGWQNPTLTIMALAARACELLARTARSGEPV